MGEPPADRAMKVRGTKREEERKVATNAKAVLCELTPASARTDHIVFMLRHAANFATTAGYQQLESQQSLNELRSQAAKSSQCSVPPTRSKTPRPTQHRPG